MNPVLLLIGKVLDKVIPDPTAKAEAQFKLLELAQKGDLAMVDADLQAMLAQAEINKVEAANADIFVSGWRPAIGWICAVGLAFTFVARPALAWLSVIQGWPEPPNPDLEQLFVLLAGMLGLGGMRTYEKLKGK